MVGTCSTVALMLLFVAASLVGTTATSAASAHLTAPAAHPALGVAVAPRSLPHPFAIRAAHKGISPTTYAGHYWDGAYFTGSAFSSTSLGVNLTVPDALPYANEFYYVIDSVWDNAGSYDQIGLTNDAGSWGFAYSYTSNCAGAYYYSPDLFSLTRGTTYQFTMTLTQGNVTFSAFAHGKRVGGLTAHTGGTAFVDQAFYSCKYGTYYDYTDYEEVYDTVQLMPSFSYFFTNNTANGTPVAGWSSFATSPANATLGIAGANVTIENQAFWMSFGKNPDSKVLKAGATVYRTQITVAPFYGGANVTLSYSGSTTAFSVTFSPKVGAPGFVTNVTIKVLAPVKNQVYQLYLDGTGAKGSYTYVVLLLRVK